MKLTAFKYGVTSITGNMAFQNGDVNAKIPIALLFFLIESDEKKILVDVGCDTMPGFELIEFKKPVEVLETYGIKRNEITDVIITHAHHDHIDAVKYYPDASIYIHKNELDEAKQYLTACQHVCLMEGDKVISENIEFKHVGGHSAGSGVVLINTNEKMIVLCGDECYTKENLSSKKPTGCSCRLDKSEWFVREFSKPEYRPILFHDPDLLTCIGFKTLYED